MTDQVALNEKQQQAVEQFYSFLLDPTQKEMIITGSPGTGKTFLMGYLGKECMKEYKNLCRVAGIAPIYREAYFSATTNKAAEVLSTFLHDDCPTIFSILSLILYRDYETGKEILKPKTTAHGPCIHNAVIFVDECSMINWDLYQYIQKRTHNCKIVYVGDKYQLAPVGESISCVFKRNIPTIELTEPVRNAGQQALLDLCEQLKETVRTGEFKPIKLVPGVIDWLDPRTMEVEVTEAFKVPDTSKRFLAYSNNAVIGYNSYILGLRSNTPFNPGDWYNVNTHIMLPDANGNTKSLPVEYEVKITSREDKLTYTFSEGNFSCTIDGYAITFHAPFKGDFKSVVAEDYRDIKEILKRLSRTQQWDAYFKLKDSIIDIRPRDCCTVHKAQGSTLDTVYIDLSDISRCNFINMVSRLLYVAVSRAKSRVVFCGKLKETYGGIKCNEEQLRYIPA